MPALQHWHAFAVVLPCFCRCKSSAKAWHPPPTEIMKRSTNARVGRTSASKQRPWPGRNATPPRIPPGPLPCFLAPRDTRSAAIQFRDEKGLATELRWLPLKLLAIAGSERAVLPVRNGTAPPRD